MRARPAEARTLAWNAEGGVDQIPSAGLSPEAPATRSCQAASALPKPSSAAVARPRRRYCPAPAPPRSTVATPARAAARASWSSLTIFSCLPECRSPFQLRGGGSHERLVTGPSGSAASSLPTSCNHPPGDSVALPQDTSKAALCVPGSGSTICIAPGACVRHPRSFPRRSRPVTREPAGILPISAPCGPLLTPPRGRTVVKVRDTTNAQSAARAVPRQSSGSAAARPPGGTGAQGAACMADSMPLPEHRVSRNGRRRAPVSRRRSIATSVRAVRTRRPARSAVGLGNSDPCSRTSVSRH